MIKFEQINTDINTDINFEVEKLLSYLRKNPRSTQKKLAEYFNVTTRTIERNITILKNAKYIERVGNNRSGYWKILK